MELIDLQLVLTHIVAFALVVWLLRKHAWGPVLRFLDERREKIRSEFAAIDSQRDEVASLRREYEEHLRNIEAEAREKMQAAVAEGNAAAARIKERAQQERRQRLVRAEEEVRLREESAQETLRKRTVDLALAAAEKAIHERLDEAKHRELMTRFIADLEASRSTGN